MIGTTLRMLREHAGYRQHELAVKVGVSSNYISLVENQRKEPSLRFLQRVASELRIPVSTFFWDDAQSHEYDDPELKQISEALNELHWKLIGQKLKKK